MGNNESLTPEETEATPRMRRVATAIRQSMRNVLDRVQGVRKVRGARLENSVKERQMDSRQLAIPIYLNQRIVFDLLAVVEDGFTQLRTIVTETGTEQSRTTQLDARLGASNIFSFLEVALNRDRNTQQSTRSTKAINEERVYTPVSLFSKLRSLMISQDLLCHLDTQLKPSALSPGKFVEFSCVLQKNPLLDSIETIIRLTEWGSIVEKGWAVGDGKKKRNNPNDNMLKLVQEFLKSMRDELVRDNMIDLVGTLVSNPSYRVVVPVLTQYFATNESPASLIDGQFVVLGKIVRTETGDNAKPINLLRGTAFGYLPDSSLIDLIHQLEEAFNIPPLEMEIKAPAFQVIPIAIFA